MKYFIVKKKHETDGHTYTSYGIMYGTVKGGEIHAEKIILDISLDFGKVQNIVRLCNRKNLSILHFDDVIYDFIE